MARLSLWNVDPKVLQEFKRFVLNKHGKLRGALSEEVTNALKFYLEFHNKHPYANLQKNLEKPRKKHIRLLLSLYYFDGELITDKILNKFIRDLGVVSKPTIRDYTNFALAFLWEEYVDRRTATIYYSIRKDLIKEFLEKHGVEVEEKNEEKEVVETPKEVKKPRGIVIESDNGNGKEPTSEISEYAAERYEAGDSLEEIKDKIELLTGSQISKNPLRSLIRKELRERSGGAYG